MLSAMLHLVDKAIMHFKYVSKCCGQAKHACVNCSLVVWNKVLFHCSFLFVCKYPISEWSMISRFAWPIVRRFLSRNRWRPAPPSMLLVLSSGQTFWVFWVPSSIFQCWLTTAGRISPYSRASWNAQCLMVRQSDPMKTYRHLLQNQNHMTMRMDIV